MLVVTTSVGMVDWVHSDSGNDGEVFSLGLVSPVLNTSLEDGLLVSASSSDDSDHSSGLAIDGLSDTRRKLNSGLKPVFRVGDDGNKGPGCSGELSIISLSELNIGDQSSLGDVSNGKDVSDL